MVEDMLAARGICVSYQTVRLWAKKFGRAFADEIRRRAAARGDKWTSMRSSFRSLASPTGFGAPSTRTASCWTFWCTSPAARGAQLLTKLLKAAAAPPRVMITDKLRSYGAALAKISHASNIARIKD